MAPALPGTVALEKVGSSDKDPTHVDDVEPASAAELAAPPTRDIRNDRPVYFEQLRKARMPLRQLPRLITKSISFVWSIGRAYFVVAVVLQLVNATGAAAQLLASRDALSAILAAADDGQDLQSVIPSLVPIGVLGAVRWATSAIGAFQASYMSQHVNALSEERLFGVVQSLELETFEDPEFYEVLVRARNGAGASWRLVTGTLGLCGNVLTVVAIGSTLFVLEPLLVLLIIISMVPMWTVNRINALRNYDLSRQQITDRRRLTYLSYLLTNRHDAKEVYAFNLAPKLRERWRDLNRKLLTEQRRLAIRSQLWSMVGSLGSATANGLTMGFALWLMLSGRLGTASAAAALYGIQHTRSQFQGILTGVGGLYTTSLYINDYETFLAIERQAMASRSTVPAPQKFGRIEVEDLTFVYPGGTIPALQGVSFEIGAGEVVALVGENGSGKSTLAKLLACLYRPTAGHVSWDGQDLQEFEPSSIRESIAVMFQDFTRYQLTVQENIGFGKIVAMDDLDAIRAAAENAGADKFLNQFPNQYSTLLTREFDPEGRDLSGGQWQRVALARAFYRDAQLVILDEPTAAMDARAEFDLFDRIRSLCRGRTVILISHRFSTVRSADRIIVLHEGAIVEQGSHEELMRQEGRYAELFTLQASSYLDEAVSKA